MVCLALNLTIATIKWNKLASIENIRDKAEILYSQMNLHG